MFFLLGSSSCPIFSKYRKPGHWCTMDPGTKIAQADQDAQNLVNKQEEARLQEELARTNDMVLLPMTDSYDKLPLKLKLGYKWALGHTTAKWIMKADDDEVRCLMFLPRCLPHFCACLRCAYVAVLFWAVWRCTHGKIHTHA